MEFRLSNMGISFSYIGRAVYGNLVDPGLQWVEMRGNGDSRGSC